MIFHRLSRCTESNDFSKTTNEMYRVACHSTTCSIKFRKINICSTVPLPLLKPVCSPFYLLLAPSLILSMSTRPNTFYLLLAPSLILSMSTRPNTFYLLLAPSLILSMSTRPNTFYSSEYFLLAVSSVSYSVNEHLTPSLILSMSTRPNTLLRTDVNVNPLQFPHSLTRSVSSVSYSVNEHSSEYFLLAVSSVSYCQSLVRPCTRPNTFYLLLAPSLILSNLILSILLSTCC